MQIRTHQLILLCLLVSLVSCGHQEAEEEPLPPVERPREVPTLYDNVVDEMYEYPDCIVNGEPCVKLHFKYPDFCDDSPLGDSLKIWTHKRMFEEESDSLTRTSADLADEWFLDYEQFLEEIEGYRIPWSLERSIEKIYKNDRLVTLHFSEFSFTGGAHPNQIEHFRSFARPGGEILRLDDLTIDKQHFQQLVELAEEQFRFTYELLESDNLEDAGYHFLNGRFHLTDNFAFTEFGLLFYFNSYEVAPFATGPIVIEIPYDDLEHLIRPVWLKDREQLTL